MSSLSQDEVKDQILNAQPIVAAIDPVTHFMPRHVVLIVGFAIDHSGVMTLRVNDPYPYTATGMMSPYKQLGGTDYDPGGLVHDISYAHFVNDIGWNETLYNIHPAR